MPEGEAAPLAVPLAVVDTVAEVDADAVMVAVRDLDGVTEGLHHNHTSTHAPDTPRHASC